MSLLDDLIYGLRKVYDAAGNLLPTRSQIQFGSGLSVTDNPATGRLVVTGVSGPSGDYLPRDGSEPMTGDLNLNGQGILRAGAINGVLLDSDGSKTKSLRQDGTYEEVGGGGALAPIGAGQVLWNPDEEDAIPTGAPLIAAAVLFDGESPATVADAFDYIFEEISALAPGYGNEVHPGLISGVVELLPWDFRDYIQSKMLVYIEASSPCTVILPELEDSLDGYLQELTFIQRGSAPFELVGASGVTVVGAKGVKSSGQYSVVKILMTETSPQTWLAHGDTTT